MATDSSDIDKGKLLWALFREGNLLLKTENFRARLPYDSEIGSLPLVGERFCYDGAGCSCRCSMLGAVDKELLSASGMAFVDLRASYGHMPRYQYALAGKGRELLYWDLHSRFCGKCGAPTLRHGSISKICSKCGFEIFPQLSPAILVLVRRGDEALLVHARNFSSPVHGLVAGFVETGESLEECVAREVREETTLEISNIRYFGSQAWPYPANLMVGFTADYASGEVRFADGELTAGGFFKPAEIPSVPTRPSLSRIMIDHWLESCGILPRED